MPVLSTLGGGSKKGFSAFGSGAAEYIDASGGTTEEYTDMWGDKWKSHTYNDQGTYSFTVNSVPSDDKSIKLNGALQKVEVLVVGGGGGGAGGHDSDWFGGGAGGAGGVVLKTNLTIGEGSNTIVVGAGGAGGVGAGTNQDQNSAGDGNNGGNSTALGYTGIGGGGGCRSHAGFGNFMNGGSGGGQGSSGNNNWKDVGESNQTHYYSASIQGGYSTGADWRGSYGGNGYESGGHPYGGGGGGAMGCGSAVHQNNNPNDRTGGAGGLPIALKMQNNTMMMYAAGGGGGGAGNCTGSDGGQGGWGMGHGNHTTRNSNAGGDGTGNGCGTGGRREGGDATDGFGHGGGGGGGGPAGGTSDGAGSGGDGGCGCVIIRYIIEENPNGAWRADNSYYDGSSSGKAAECARDIDSHTAGTPSNGFYWIKPQWYPGNPYRVYCNFTADGGNWMRYAVGGSTTDPGGNKIAITYDVYYGGAAPMNVERSYSQASFSRFDLAKYHKNISTRDDATDSQMMWRRINDSNPIMIHNIPQKVFQRNGASHFGQDQNYAEGGVESVATSTASATNGGYSPFKEDGCSIRMNWPCWNDDMMGDGAGGVKLNLFKTSNNGEGSLTSRGTGGSNPYPCRYETGPGYSGIAWNSNYGDNQDNAGGYNNYMNRRALVYWETNGAQGSGQWFHGTALSMNVSNSPYESQNRKDVEVYFRPTIS